MLVLHLTAPVYHSNYSIPIYRVTDLDSKDKAKQLLQTPHAGIAGGKGFLLQLLLNASVANGTNKTAVRTGLSDCVHCSQ